MVSPAQDSKPQWPLFTANPWMFITGPAWNKVDSQHIFFQFVDTHGYEEPLEEAQAGSGVLSGALGLRAGLIVFGDSGIRTLKRQMSGSGEGSGIPHGTLQEL